MRHFQSECNKASRGQGLDFMLEIGKPIGDLSNSKKANHLWAQLAEIDKLVTCNSVGSQDLLVLIYPLVN